MLAVGEHLWGAVDERTRRMATGLGGGVGRSHEEMCGALSAGVLIIGGLHGRVVPTEDDSECHRLVADYRARFIEALGASHCFELRQNGYGSSGQWPCSIAVERATRILLDILAGAQA